MRKILITVAVAIAAVAVAPSAGATTPRVDTYYEVWCTDGAGNLVQAESVDAHAIEQGGKAAAIDRFSANYPFGLTCWPVGPFTP